MPGRRWIVQGCVLAALTVLVPVCGGEGGKEAEGESSDSVTGSSGTGEDGGTGGSTGGGSTGTDTGTETGDGSGTGEPEMTDSIEDHGVTWTFAEPVSYGRFITGDPWIVCPATVVAIDPPPAGGRNGSVLNLPPVDDRSGFDDRVAGNRFDETLRVYPPLDLVAGDRLLSSISVDVPGEVENWLREGSGESSDSPVWSVSVLTCLSEAAPADAFRPSYADPALEMWRWSDVDLALLPALAPPAAFDPALLDEVAARTVRPWIDNLFFGFDAQVEYMAMYGREVGRVASMAALFVMLDLPQEMQASQELVLVGLIQRGIDLWGLARAGHPGWPAFGGHGSGRKTPIVMAGLLLGDQEMASPGATLPDVRFGEDMHTAFVADLAPPADVPTWWDSSQVVYTGHQGVWAGTAVSADPAWGPYEHLAPESWLEDIGESYRRCCTSIAWVGQSLAIELLAAEGPWAHDAFSAYVERWMDPTGDADYTAEILARTGWDFTGGWAAHGQAWDAFVEEMWATYH